MPTQPSFDSQMPAYKQAIDDDIAAYAQHVQETTHDQFGPYSAVEIDTFLDVLSRGGKRLRGALVMVGYELCGGTNRAMILQAARAIEMLHAYMLILDDIQDRSPLRRGKSTAHEMLAAYHKQHKLRGDAAHFGMSIALNAASGGAHAAMVILANMDADPQLRLNVLSITNRTLNITAHGQTQDIFNAALARPTVADVKNVLEWKTALYSFINPLHVGMVLAGADCRVTDAITPYATHLGKAFQIIDDINGVFADPKITGKPTGDDIREGKVTVVMAYALQHADPSDVTFLRSCLGNQSFVAADLSRCQDIMERCGARKSARNTAATHVKAALRSLRTQEVKAYFGEAEFFRQLAGSLAY